jgi:hypothetical protein
MVRDGTTCNVVPTLVIRPATRSTNHVPSCRRPLGARLTRQR